HQTEIMGAFLPWYTFVAVILLVIHGGLCVDIIGGNEVKPHSRPFMAQIKGQKGDFCGGALIKENWVLTAAHCKVEKGKVILGAHSLKKREKEQQTFRIAKLIAYPCYDPSTKENDIMLLQLQGRAKLNKAVRPISLPPSYDDPKPGTICTVAGWGKTGNNPYKIPTALMEVNITVIKREICNDKYHYNGKPVITENMICAGAKNGGKDSCDGDSGGPLICNNELRGITSFGKQKRCGKADSPGVYTRLTERYLEWIRKTIGG
ncbi:GRAA protein, partial [Toxostoma redivivum]|nr:GRAA protein [Toxostoma redivivum]